MAKEWKKELESLISTGRSYGGAADEIRETLRYYHFLAEHISPGCSFLIDAKDLHLIGLSL